MSLSLTRIRRYPVKSFRGEDLSSAVVEPWGLAGDRRWMVVDEDGRFRTARELPRMLLIRPEITDGGLQLSAPDLGSVFAPLPDGRSLTPVTVWGSTVDAALTGAEVADWLTAAIGLPSRLVYLDDPTRRPTNPDRTDDGDRVSFADGYPLLATTESSLAALNDAIADGPRADEGPVPMLRFRPNVVVAGSSAWDEDGWRRIRIGDATFRAVKGCARCVLTTVDPETAAKGKEPITTLARIRRWDGQTWFGVNLVPDTPDVSISVGDPVEVIEGVDPVDGPQR